MTEEVIEKKLIKLFQNYFFEKPVFIKRIKGGVSDRIVYKIVSKNYICIGVHNTKLKENKAFIEFSKAFKSAGLNVPEIYHVSDDNKFYIEEFVGNLSLYDFINDKKVNSIKKIQLYKKALTDLVNIQLKGDKVIKYKYCYETQDFNYKQIFFDFNKFYNYYLNKLTDIKFKYKGKTILINLIAKEILEEKKLYFMYRDFQPRNIMIKDDSLYYIDYQSGRKGPLQYDAASFLYSGSIDLDEEERIRLLNFYIGEISKKMKINKDKFISSFYYFAFIRLLQILGSYGFLYHKSRDKNLLVKIDKAVKNIADIKRYIKNENLKYFAEKISPF
jgi:aminoglycoside/choline kinase family phosphotransferase